MPAEILILDKDEREQLHAAATAVAWSTSNAFKAGTPKPMTVDARVILGLIQQIETKK